MASRALSFFLFLLSLLIPCLINSTTLPSEATAKVILGNSNLSYDPARINVDLVTSSMKQLYIVYMGEGQYVDPELVTASHHDMLTSLLGSKEKALASIVYSYRHGFSGFAAMLTQAQATEVAGYPGVISVEPNRIYKLQTTRSWDFLGLDLNQPSGLLQKAKYGEGAIIGVIDSGIWPESPSFNDRGYGSIPSRWKGKCMVADSFGLNNCSRKIIGARWYTGGVAAWVLKGEYMSPRDFSGHGTHTASTAAGEFVANTSYHGLAAGTVRGGAPRARLAIYKACWGEVGQCGSAAVVKAIDDAIHDGVDVLSLSIGGDGYPHASRHAVSKGIVVVFAGGNQGPAPQTVANSPPWVITVAASTIDRSFPTVITLGNGLKVVGQSFFTGAKKGIKSELLTWADGCDADSVNGTDVSGLLVLCYSLTINPEITPRGDLSGVISRLIKAGAKGLIYSQYAGDIFDILLSCRDIPCVSVDFETAGQIFDYFFNTALANRTTVVKVSPARTVTGGEVWSPKIGAFSSRGPSPAFPQLLKPDIAAPGVSILASYGAIYKPISGTSMACPHVTGIVTLLKLLHPDWSPAAIKSAIVTTASVTDRYGVPIQADGVPRKIADPFDYGGGQINPNRAVDPGLVYDSNPKDYFKMFNCTFSEFDYCYSSKRPLYDINLPSIAIPELEQEPITTSRTVTNVGAVNAVYKAVVQSPPGIEMTVEPSTLVFNAKSKTQAFKITFKSLHKVQGYYTFGSLTWIDSGAHSVRIQVAVRTVIQDNYADAP